MRITTKSGKVLEVPDDEEEKSILSGIKTDLDTYELKEEEFEKLRPVGRPKAEETKERITIRLSADVVEYFRSTGKGWQTRMDEALKEYVASRP